MWESTGQSVSTTWGCSVMDTGFMVLYPKFVCLRHSEAEQHQNVGNSEQRKIYCRAKLTENWWLVLKNPKLSGGFETGDDLS